LSEIEAKMDINEGLRKKLFEQEARLHEHEMVKDTLKSLEITYKSTQGELREISAQLEKKNSRVENIEGELRQVAIVKSQIWKLEEDCLVKDLEAQNFARLFNESKSNLDKLSEEFEEIRISNESLKTKTRNLTSEVESLTKTNKENFSYTKELEERLLSSKLAQDQITENKFLISELTEKSDHNQSLISQITSDRDTWREKALKNESLFLLNQNLENDKRKLAQKNDELELTINDLEKSLNDLQLIKADGRKWKSQYGESCMENEKLLEKLKRFKQDSLEKDLHINS
jgi:chromosome segregation ATPase